MKSLFLAFILMFVGCSKREIIIPLSPNPNFVQLADVTGKKMSDVKIQSISIDEFSKINWTFSRKFSNEDIELAKLAVSFIENISGLRYNCNYQNMYWSDDMLRSMGTNSSLLGMTVFYEYRESWRAYIGVTSSLKPPTIHDLNAMRDFGLVIIHECLHASNLDIESLVRAKIERPVDMSYDFYCAVGVSNFFLFKTERFANKPYKKMIEKVAFDVGIGPPWHYNRDYLGDPIRPVIQILMVPETTNSTPRANN
jgi:hypothetical protein